MTDLDALTIRQASRLLERGGLTSVELVEATLRRIEETEPLVHAYVTVTPEEALEAARVADEERARGRVRGPLHGIPFGVKDVLCTAGVATEAGSRVLAGYVPAEDATAVRRLRDAGAVLLGKHVTHEFATGQNVPPTRNPWNLAHYPGGSSAGGGVSVAIGSSLLALGTDAGGSIRKPAAVTSVVGLKATHGRVSGHGALPTASYGSLDHVGPFTRTVEDAALVLAAIAGFDPLDVRSLDAPVPDYLEGLGAGVGGLRLGVERDYFFGPELEDDVRPQVEEALGELKRLGATLVPVRLPSLPLTLPAGFTILMAAVAPSHRRLLAERAADYTPETRRLIALGSLLPAAHVGAAERARARMREEMRVAFRDARLDALVTPTLPRTSIPLDEMVIPLDLPKFIPYTMPANLTGQPALSVPCGFTPAGLPTGLQLVGRPLDEATLFRIAHAYEQATPWHERRPTVTAVV